MDLTTIAPWVAAGGSSGLAFFALRWLVEWMSNRFDQNNTNIASKRENLDAGMVTLIEALQKQVLDQDRRIDELTKRVDGQREREITLEDENDDLRGQVKALEKRLDELEALFKRLPIPPELQAEIERIDQTAPRRRGKK